MHHDDVEFHNVAELQAVEGADGLRPQRVPESIREGLNETARERVRLPSNVELRFVADGPATVTLSCPTGESEATVFYGPFQGRETFHLDDEPTEITVEPHERLASRLAAIDDTAFDPAVRRIRLRGHWDPIHYHGVEGDVRPPRADELPDLQYLAYGTSITAGRAATAEHLKFAVWTARHLGADLQNLGTGGSAYCDPPMAEYVAAADWDLATLEISGNMVGNFTPDEFETRARHFVERVAESHPEAPVVAISVPTRHKDLDSDGATAEVEAFRERLATVVADAPSNVHLVRGTDLLDLDGLSEDLVHPGDYGMATMARRLAAELDQLR